MKIDEQQMFATPKGWKTLESWIERHPAEDRIHLYTAAMMAWNLAARITNSISEADFENSFNHNSEAE